jgi:exopolysaccharide biosynthesis protein
LEGGRLVGDLEMAERPGFAAERHPRTAVGFDAVGRRLWFVVLEGRREGFSEGMSLPELAGLFRALKAFDAINLDGGGSSVMVIRGEAVSRPSDPAGERAVVNGLILRKDEAYCG